jgi:hypothetical protein
MWIDISDSTTVTLSGDLITQVNDKSGNGFNLLGPATMRPALISAELNGLNVARFDGTDDILISNTDGAGSVSWNLLNNKGSALLVAVRKVTNAASRREIFLISTNTPGVARATLIAGATASKNGLAGRRLDADSVQLVASTNNLDTAAFEIHIGEFDWTNSNANIYIDGSFDGGTTTFQTDGSTSATNTSRVAIGSASVAPALPMPGDIAEVICIESDITESTRQKIEGYLAHKWGLTANLPADHPYKTERPTS